jgi:hypothetical protein
MSAKQKAVGGTYLAAALELRGVNVQQLVLEQLGCGDEKDESDGRDEWRYDAEHQAQQDCDGDVRSLITVVHVLRLPHTPLCTLASR